MDSEHRPFQLFMHVIGTPHEEDKCILEEVEDSRFWMGLQKTADERFLIVSLDSPETSEQYAIDLHGLQGGEQHLQRIYAPLVEGTDQVRAGNWIMRRIFQIQDNLRFSSSGSYYIVSMVILILRTSPYL